MTRIGKPQKRHALYGQFEPNDQMVTTAKADQKIFASCEFQPDFVKTGKFGLVGLAITGSPEPNPPRPVNYAVKFMSPRAPPNRAWC